MSSDMMEMLSAVGAQNDFTQYARVKESSSEAVYLSNELPYFFLTTENNQKEYFKIAIDSGFHAQKQQHRLEKS